MSPNDAAAPDLQEEFREDFREEFNEESFFSEEPPGQPAPPAPVGEKLSVAVIALGGLAFVLCLLGTPLTGTWLGLLASFGLMSAGTVALFWFRYRDTTPGIKHNGIFFGTATYRGSIAWGLGVFLTGFYVVLYLYERFEAWGLPVLDRAIRMLDPLARALAGGPADRWFLYGFLYTLAVLVFGVRMFLKYRHNRYHLVRTASVMFFQLGFAFVIPNLLKLFKEPEFYFSYFWPLKWQYLWPGDVNSLLESPGRLGVFMVFWGAVMSLVAVPVLTYFYGKRWYCSWVCGCGGLAETLGDPWRQLSDKSTGAWKVERWLIHGVLVFITLTTLLLWINSATEGAVLGGASQTFADFYGLYIGAIFAGVIGVGFYPLMGSRVWCRFGCPQAAILGLFQRFFSRFRITTNGGQCMSCGNCSTYCEMGIDVRAYAQRSANIVRASCVGCGVCAAVCPRGVLRLENGGSRGDRFPRSDQPLQAFLNDLQGPSLHRD